MTVEFGQIIQQHIDKSNGGITVRELARRTRYLPRTVNDIINGTREVNHEGALRMTQALNLAEEERDVFLTLAAGYSQEEVDQIAFAINEARKQEEGFNHAEELVSFLDRLNRALVKAGLRKVNRRRKLKRTESTVR
ncbi:MAG: hypothetical protein NUV69_01855 [Candidatus Curtissbacteria bacterium]|nr:hypothetical protein [Candidatus Curtissbacteria bacterium]